MFYRIGFKTKISRVLKFCLKLYKIQALLVFKKSGRIDRRWSLDGCEREETRSKTDLKWSHLVVFYNIIPISIFVIVKITNVCMIKNIEKRPWLAGPTLKQDCYGPISRLL